MEIKLNAGANLVIPDGCKATIKNGVVSIEKDEQEFKKGDFLTTNSGIIFIFDKYVSDEYFDSLFNTYRKEYNKGWAVNKARFATEEEKQILIEKLHEAGKDWDAEKCEVIDYEWKPNIDEHYYLAGFTERGYRPTIFTNTGTFFDKEVFNSKIFFKTDKLCQDFCNKVNELLRNTKRF